MSVVHADLFDEQPKELFRLLRVWRVEEHLFELVGEPAEGGLVRRRVGLCGECLGEVGFVAAERFEPRAVAADALFEEGW